LLNFFPFLFLLLSSSLFPFLCSFLSFKHSRLLLLAVRYSRLLHRSGPAVVRCSATPFSALSILPSGSVAIYVKEQRSLWLIPLTSWLRDVSLARGTKKAALLAFTQNTPFAPLAEWSHFLHLKIKYSEIIPKWYSS
jgi:hypothetical protein